MGITTPKMMRYPIMIRAYLDFFFMFRVRACRNVALLLTSMNLQGVGDFYSIDIGSNGNEIIIWDHVSVH